MTQQDSSKNAPLDLGLSALIGQASQDESAAGEKPSVVNDETAEALEGPPEPEQQTRKLNPFEDLHEKESWTELSKLAEMSLEKEGLVALEAKLWWLKAQHELAAMPPAILAAPLETLIVDLSAYDFGEVSSHPEDERDRLYHYLVQFVCDLRPVLSPGISSALAEHLEQAGFSVDARVASTPVVSKQEENEGAPSEESAKADISTKNSPDSDPQVKQEPRKTHQRQLLSYLLFCLGLLGCLWWYRYRYLSDQVLESRPPVVALHIEAPPLRGPQDERISRVSQLDAVLFDAEGGTGGSGEGNTTDTASAQTASSPNPKETRAPKERVVVDTSGPLEPEGLLEKHRSAPRRDTERSEYSSSSGGSSSTRTPLGAEIFRVLVRTEVLAKPTFTANRIGYLQVGDEVEVERSEGPWLQVRSRMGRVGFVLSQDVVPAR